jgi:hypothetical protein
MVNGGRTGAAGAGVARTGDVEEGEALMNLSIIPAVPDAARSEGHRRARTPPATAGRRRIHRRPDTVFVENPAFPAWRRSYSNASHARMSAVFNFTFVPWFRSVAPYIHTHRGKTFVVGLAGEAIAAGKLQNIAQDLALIQSMGVKVVLVHGFRPQVNEQLRA